MSHHFDRCSCFTGNAAAAPLGRVRTSDASMSDSVSFSSVVSRCSRRRGTRSRIARVRRWIGNRGIAPTGEDSSESGSPSPVNANASQPNDFRIYNVNIRCLLSKLPELIVHVERLDPHLVFIKHGSIVLSRKSVFLITRRLLVVIEALPKIADE